MFRKLGLFVIALAISACTLQPLREGDIPDQIVAWGQANAYKIKTSGGTGSGWWINKNHLITNCHVVASVFFREYEEGMPKTAIVESYDGKWVLPVTISSCNRDKDLALLTFTDNDVWSPPILPTEIINEDVEVGKGLWGVGYPLGGPLHITKGHKTAQSHWAAMWAQISVPTIMGDSGSAALMLVDGRVVVAGVRARVASVPQGWFNSYLPHIAIMIKGTVVHEFLGEQKADARN